MNNVDEPQRGATIYCDSESATTISKNPVFHRKTKHIKVKYSFIREVQDERVKLVKIKGEAQLSARLSGSGFYIGSKSTGGIES